MKTQSSLNGVDAEQLMRTVEDIKATPALAVFKFRAKNKWLNGGHNRSVIKSFSGNGQENKVWQLDNDEPPVLLGTDHAPNPKGLIPGVTEPCGGLLRPISGRVQKANPSK